MPVLLLNSSLLKLEEIDIQVVSQLFLKVKLLNGLTRIFLLHVEHHSLTLPDKISVYQVFLQRELLKRTVFLADLLESFFGDLLIRGLMILLNSELIVYSQRGKKDMQKNAF